MSSNNLKQRIQDDMKNALRAHETERLAVIRMLWAAVRQVEIDKRITADDPQVIAILDKMLRQRQEAIEQFQAGGREDLVNKESFEIKVLKAYLPPPLSATEIEQLIKTAIKETGASSIRDMGKVIARIKPQVQGRADMGQISTKIKTLLGQD